MHIGDAYSGWYWDSIRDGIAHAHWHGKRDVDAIRYCACWIVHRQFAGPKHASMRHSWYAPEEFLSDLQVRQRSDRIRESFACA